MNSQPGAYEHSSCPCHHPIPETTRRAISLGRCSYESLRLSPSHRNNESTLFVSTAYTNLSLLTTVNSEFVNSEFGLKQVPWTLGEGAKSTHRIVRIRCVSTRVCPTLRTLQVEVSCRTVQRGGGNHFVNWTFKIDLGPAWVQASRHLV